VPRLSRTLILTAVAALAVGIGVGVLGALLLDGGDDEPEALPTPTPTRFVSPTATAIQAPTPTPVIFAPVIVREGPARLGPLDDALVIVGDDLLESLIKDALEGADLPVELSEVASEFEREGIRVRGEVTVELLGASFSGDFSALVRPYAEEGDIRVDLTDIDAEGLDLPGLFDDSVSDAVNSRLGEVVQLEGYAVRDVEVGEDELLVYLEQVP
jgi:hypothetical protein